MASLTRLLSITIIVILGVLSISSTEARPCKTLLITSYSIPYRPRIRLFPNDLTDSSSFQPQSHGSVTIVSSGFIIHKTPIFSVDDNVILGFRQFHNHHQHHRRQESEEDEVVGGVFGMFDSLRDRTKDVLSVVFALLLGVGCGALTAGAMYLLWFFFTGSCCIAYDSEDDYDDDEDDITAKKIGYVMIPSEVDDAIKPKQVDITIQPVCNKV